MEVKEPSSIGSGTGGVVRVGPAEDRAARMPGARLVTLKVSGDRTGGAYSLFEVEVGPGGGEGPHVQHREDECLYVVEGRFGFEIEGLKTEAGPGAHLYVLKGALHAYENVGRGTGRLLAIHTPGGPHEGFLAAAGGPQGPARDTDGFAVLAAEHGIEICEPTRNIERSF